MELTMSKIVIIILLLVVFAVIVTLILLGINPMQSIILNLKDASNASVEGVLS